MNAVPDDMLLEIFSYVSQKEVILSVRRVCVRWYKVSYTGDLWHTIDLTKYKEKSIQAAMVSNLKHIQDHVKTLTVAPRLLQTIFNNHIWQFLTLKQLHLTSLVGQTTTILGEPNLRYPRLEKVSFESFTDNDTILSAFSDFTIDTLSWKYNGPFSSFRDSIVTLNEMENLQKIRIHLYNLDNESLNYLLKNCKILTSLELYICNLNITDDAFLSLKRKCQLTEFGLPYTSITDIALQIISDACPHLKVINISNCYQITDTGLSYLAENCVRLENINISNIPSLTRRSIYKIADHCISLKTLNVKKSNGVENDAITNILQKCSQLVKLDISHCQNVTKSWLSEKNTICMNVALSLSLREIFLNGNGSITSAVLMRILTSCTCLKHIGVANCISIYGLIIENWTEHPQPLPCACKSTRISSTVDNSKRVENSKHSHIISINLNMSSNIEDTTITQITDICPDLRHINLSGCAKLTTNILPTIFRNCCFIDKIELQKMLFLRENHIED